MCTFPWHWFLQADLCPSLQSYCHSWNALGDLHLEIHSPLWNASFDFQNCSLWEISGFPDPKYNINMPEGGEKKHIKVDIHGRTLYRILKDLTEWEKEALNSHQTKLWTLKQMKVKSRNLYGNQTVTASWQLQLLISGPSFALNVQSILLLPWQAICFVVCFLMGNDSASPHVCHSAHND